MDRAGEAFRRRRARRSVTRARTSRPLSARAYIGIHFARAYVVPVT
ncbi:hypothetical protein [Streptomyces sp. CC219B]|nr:hypothetical protein [Streptomyces sp. CC219B]